MWCELIDEIAGPHMKSQVKNGMAIIGLVVMVLVFVGALIHDSATRAARIAKAQKLVETTANIFDVDENFQEMTIIDKDPWGNALRIKIQGVEEKDIFRECTVTSAGPDKEFGTKDDIFDANMNFHPEMPSAKATGEAIGKTTGRFGIGVTKGLIEAVKEEFNKD